MIALWEDVVDVTKYKLKDLFYLQQAHIIFQNEYKMASVYL